MLCFQSQEDVVLQASGGHKTATFEKEKQEWRVSKRRWPEGLRQERKQNLLPEKGRSPPPPLPRFLPFPITSETPLLPGVKARRVANGHRHGRVRG